MVDLKQRIYLPPSLSTRRSQNVDTIILDERAMQERVEALQGYEYSGNRLIIPTDSEFGRYDSFLIAGGLVRLYHLKEGEKTILLISETQEGLELLTSKIGLSSKSTKKPAQTI